MRKAVSILRIVFLLIPLIVYLYRFLPPVLPLLEIVLLNQTIRLMAGLAFILLFALLFFKTRRGILLYGVAGIASALLVSEIGPYSGFNHTKNAGGNRGDELTIYSQNILYCSHSVRKLIHNIEALDPKVIVLQEVCEHDWKRLAYLLSKRGYENAPCIGVSPNRSLGFAIFSRLPLRNREAILLSDVDWSPVWPAQSVEFWYQNRWIKLFNIHLIPPHHGQRNEVLPRPCQYMIARDQVEELISMAGQTPAPTIICGDFNQTPASKLMRPFFSRWNDTWTEGGDGFGFTWGTTLPLFRIDYILSPPQLRTVSAKIIKNDFSDHFGLYVVMEIDKK